MSTDEPNEQVISEVSSRNGEASEPETLVLGELFEDESDEEWVVASQAKRVRLRVPTAALVVAILCAGAFWGGAAVQRANGGSSTARGAAAAASSASSRVGASSGAPSSSSTSAPTTGLVTDLQGNTLYVTTSTGSLVKVALVASTVITRNAKVTASDLQPGDTVVVVGSTSSNGTVTATSVAATAAGVTAGGSAYAGGFGGARSATSTTTAGG